MPQSKFNAIDLNIGVIQSSTTSWTSASSLFHVCHYWTNWLIQVCLTLVVTTTIIRHTWINQVCAIMADRKQGAGWSSGSSAAVHKANSTILFTIS